MRHEILSPDTSPLKYRVLKAPFTAQIELTEKCNNRCVHCYNFYRSFGLNILSPEKTRAVIKQLGEAGVFSITFTGGEPLTVMESLLIGLQESQNWGMRVALNSNLTVGRQEDFEELRKSGLNGILTTLLSSNKNLHNELVKRQGAFGQVIAGIKKAKLAGLRVAVNMVVSKANLKDVYATGKFCRQELGIDSFYATRVGPSSYNLDWFNSNKLEQSEVKNMLDQLISLQEELGVKVDSLEPFPYCGLEDLQFYEVFTRRRCVAGVSTCCIGADGGVRSCSHAEVVYGNVFDENFLEVWQEMSQWREGSLIPKECWDCSYLVKCRAGCRVMGIFSKGIKGEINQPDLYATEEEKIISDLPPKGEELNLPNDFHLVPLTLFSKTKFREESFGGVVVGRDLSPFLLDNFNFSFLKQLNKSKFTLRQLSEKFGYSIEELTNFFGRLFVNGIVILAEDEEKGH